MTIRAQLATFAALIAVPLIALLAYHSYAQLRADTARAAEAVQRVARSAAADTRRTLEETERALRRLAAHAPVRALSPSQCDPAIEDFRAVVSSFANIVTINNAGELVCSAVQGTRVNRSLKAVEWVQRALQARGRFISPPTASVVTGEPVVYLTHRLEGGLIAAALQISAFEPVSEEHGFAEDTVISIVDADGYMVARSTDARTWVGRNVRGQGVVDVALARKTGYVIAPGLMGIERVFGFAPVEGAPWVVYAGVRSDVVFAHARSLALRSAALAGFVILITLALVVWMAHRIGGSVAAQYHGREQLLQQVIDTVPAIIHVKDAEGRYRLVNRQFEKVTGIAAREALGRRDAELFAADIAARVTQNDREALERSGVLFVEESVNGRHYVVGKAALRDGGGRPSTLCTAAFDITQRKQLEERQRRLSRRVFEVSEEERQRLSRELHDRIGQPLAALRINLHVLRERFPAQASAELDRQAALVEELIRLVRVLTAELRPPELDSIGLAAALRNYADQASARYGFVVDVLGSEFEPRLPRVAERALFRIAQEALANAAKHARAETVTIELEQEAGAARVCVADDGKGFDAAQRRDGFGLHTMRERAEEAGGRLEIESAEGIGTRIIAIVPRPT